MLILSDIKDLMKNIDELKKNLNILLDKKDFNLQDEEIIKASQELDIAINKYNELIIKNVKK